MPLHSQYGCAEYHQKGLPGRILHLHAPHLRPNSLPSIQLLDVSDDGYLSLMDDAGNTRDDLKNPDGDVGEEIKGAIGDGKDILVSINGSFTISRLYTAVKYLRFLLVHGVVRLWRGVRDCH